MQAKPRIRAATPAAERALAEAEARRWERAEKATQAEAEAATEIEGPKGPDPVRYGDWEKGGIASDF
jgi:hypothetical protein